MLPNATSIVMSPDELALFCKNVVDMAVKRCKGEWVTRQEAIKELGGSRQRFDNFVADGTIKPISAGANCKMKILRSDLDYALEIVKFSRTQRRCHK